VTNCLKRKGRLVIHLIAKGREELDGLFKGRTNFSKKKEPDKSCGKEGYSIRKTGSQDQNLQELI